MPILRANLKNIVPSNSSRIGYNDSLLKLYADTSNLMLLFCNNIQDHSFLSKGPMTVEKDVRTLLHSSASVTLQSVETEKLSTSFPKNCSLDKNNSKSDVHGPIY
jgi:hypothetical protein